MKKSAPILVVLILVVAFVAACGRKASPEPPEDTAPSEVRYLTVTPTVDAIVLSWEVPQTNAKGKDLVNLAGFFVRRHVRALGTDSEIETVGEIAVTPLAPQTGNVVQTETPQTVEMKYSYRDTAIEPGKIYEYIVVPYNKDEVEGVPSHLIRVTFSGESSVIESL